MRTILLKIIKQPIFWAIIALLVSAVVIVILAKQIRALQTDNARLEQNQAALLSDIETYRADNGNLVATVNAVSLRKDELEELMPKYVTEIQQLKLKIKNLQSFALVTTKTELTAEAPISIHTPTPRADSTLLVDSQPPKDPPIAFEWHDDWVMISGKVENGIATCDVSVIDSLVIVAHRKPRKCIFRRKGKVIGYSVESKNPHTEVTGLEYIEVID